MHPATHQLVRTTSRSGRPLPSGSPPRRVLGARNALDSSSIRMALALNSLLRDKHEGLNRGNADPPIA